jgi:hypothetical protein
MMTGGVVLHGEAYTIDILRRNQILSTAEEKISADDSNIYINITHKSVIGLWTVSLWYVANQCYNPLSSSPK